MQVVKMARQEFLGWMGGEQGFVSGEFRAAFRLKPRDVAFLFHEQDHFLAKMGAFVVSDESEREDFFAFADTYIGAYSPFSAFFRVFTLPEIRHWTKSSDTERDAVFARGLVGAVICANLGAKNRQTRPRNNIYDHLESTAFLLARSIFSQSISVPDALNRHLHCRSLLGVAHETRIDPAILEFWSILDGLFKGRPLLPTLLPLNDRPFIEVLETIIFDRGLSDKGWSVLLRAYPFLSEVRESMAGAREKRARAFTSIISSPAMGRAGRDSAMIVGLLGSLLAGGAFEYAELMTGLAEAYPAAPVWFGFFSGISENADVLTWGQSVGRHLLREVINEFDVLGAPTSDIAFAELVIAARTKGGINSLALRRRGSVMVEISPGVDMAFNIDLASPNINGVVISRERHAEMRRLTSRLSKILNDDFASSSSDEQNSLFRR